MGNRRNSGETLYRSQSRLFDIDALRRDAEVSREQRRADGEKVGTVDEEFEWYVHGVIGRFADPNIREEVVEQILQAVRLSDPWSSEQQSRQWIMAFASDQFAAMLRYINAEEASEEDIMDIANDSATMIAKVLAQEVRRVLRRRQGK